MLYYIYIYGNKNEIKEDWNFCGTLVFHCLVQIFWRVGLLLTPLFLFSRDKDSELPNDTVRLLRKGILNIIVPVSWDSRGIFKTPQKKQVNESFCWALRIPKACEWYESGTLLCGKNPT